MSRKIILDVDTGTDDAIAIMLAACHKDIELIGITVANGNTSLEACTDNTLRVLSLIGAQHIPVYPGLDSPLVRRDLPEPRKSGDVGSSLHGTTLPLPEATMKAQSTSAIEFLIETYRNTSEQITLVPVAPLSNIAAAIKMYPKLVDLIPEVVLMGGCHAFGNRTAAAEFNIWADPEAAAVVFEAGFEKITMIPLDATYNAALSLDDCKALDNLGSKPASTASNIIRSRIENYDRIQPVGCGGVAPVHDALAVASIIDPSVINTKHLHVAIETKGEHTLGRTVIDTTFRGANRSLPPNCHVAFSGNSRLFAKILLDGLSAI